MPLEKILWLDTGRLTQTAIQHVPSKPPPILQRLHEPSIMSTSIDVELCNDDPMLITTTSAGTSIWWPPMQSSKMQV